MKKMSIILIGILFFLSACTEERPISTDLLDNTTITQYEGESFIDIYDYEIKDFEGNDLIPFIEFVGNYDLNVAGNYSLKLTVSDGLGESLTIPFTLEILEPTCEMDDRQDKCTIHVESIELTAETAVLTYVYIDDFIKLKWTIEPVNAEFQAITISSSDESIATVNTYGYIFGHKAGVVTITITTLDGQHTIEKEITVLEETCTQNPLQDKCASDILDDQSRIVALGDTNISGTNYKEVYVNNDLYYEIYVRTFADSDGNNKGDIQGIIDNLPYLKNLGVSGIWLMPITQSRSDHGYEVDDYYDVDNEYGTIDDMKELVSTAEALGIDIIIDLVVNHMGASNDIFQDVLINGTNSDYYDWFVWISDSDNRDSQKGSWGQTIWYNPTDRTWLKNGYFDIHSSLSDKYYCAYFSDWMPDLNLENPEVRQYIKDVGAFWLQDIGVAGFRMDATSHFYGHNEYLGISDTHAKNIEVLTELNSYWESINPDVYIVGEAWESYQLYGTYYASGISLMNFQASYNIRDMANGNLWTDIGTAMNQTYNTFKNFNPNFIDAPFMSNHDMDRIIKQVGENDARIAAEILLTLPGNPFIYYGDEIGLYGTRTNMLFGDYYDSLFANYEDRNVATVSEQLIDPDSLLNSYISLGQTRQNSLALSYGEFAPYNANSLQGYYRYFENGQDKELVIVLFNFSSVSHKPIPEEFTSYEILYKTFESNFGGISPRGMMILRLPYSLKDDLIS